MKLEKRSSYSTIFFAHVLNNISVRGMTSQDFSLRSGSLGPDLYVGRSATK